MIPDYGNQDLFDKENTSGMPGMTGPVTAAGTPQMAPVCPYYMLYPQLFIPPVVPSVQPMVPLYPGPGMPGIMGPGTMYMGPADAMETDEMDIAPMASTTSDPPPVLSNNPAIATITLFKELTGYPNYGNPSGNADILYTGNRGAWTFEIPFFLFIPGNLRGQLIIRAVLDDHYNVPVSRYSASIAINGVMVHTGRVPLEHGSPSGGRFTNWKELSFNMPSIRRVNRVVIVNTSTAGQNDWIGLDWMEMRLTAT